MFPLSACFDFLFESDELIVPCRYSVGDGWELWRIHFKSSSWQVCQRGQCYLFLLFCLKACKFVYENVDEIIPAFEILNSYRTAEYGAFNCCTAFVITGRYLAYLVYTYDPGGVWYKPGDNVSFPSLECNVLKFSCYFVMVFALFMEK